jgi:YfiH family protein
VPQRLRWRLARGVEVRASFTDRTDGDLAIGVDPDVLEARRAAVAPTPWTWLEQVHGAEVVVVRHPGDRAGERADAAVTDVAGAALAVQVADCAPVLLFSPGPRGAVVGAAHAGWRGLVAGVLPATVEAMRRLGATDIGWALGPCVSPAAYEFSGPDLDRLARRLGDAVRGVTSGGAPALDVAAAVRSSLAEAGVDSPPHGPPPPCTATSARHWSHRAAADSARQAGVIWWQCAGADGEGMDGW